MAYCTDAFSQGWQHMVKVLFSPVRVGFWFLMAFFMFICEDLLHISPFKFFPNDLFEKAAVDPSVLEPFLMSIIVVGVSYFFLSLIFMLFSSGARMVYLIGVRNGSVSVFKALEDLLPRIITYFLWNVIVPFIAIIVLFVVSLIFAIAVMLPFGVTDPLSAGIAVTLIMVFIGLVTFVIVLTYLMVMRSFVVPMMVFQNKGIFSAIGSSFGLIFSHFFECAGFLMIRFASLMGLLAVFILPTLGVLMVFEYIDTDLLRDQHILRGFISNINLLILSAILEPILLPYNIFVDSYGLAFLKKLTGDNCFLPGAEGEKTDVSSPSDTSNPSLQPVVSSEQPTPPPSPVPPMTSVPLNNEPVNFKDIPVDPVREVSPPTEQPPQDSAPEQEEPKNDPPQPPSY
jgi:hypothetical protein